MKSRSMLRGVIQHPVAEESYRVFLSYCSADRKLALAIARVLGRGQGGLGFDVSGMHKLPAGIRFTEELCSWIATSHVLIVLLTPNSLGHPWVSQEIGYALGHCIPVFAITCGVNPNTTGMLAEVQARDITSLLKPFPWIRRLWEKPPDSRPDSGGGRMTQRAVDRALLGKLRTVRWRKLALPVSLHPCPAYLCDTRAAARPALLADAAEKIHRLSARARIRQRSHLSSFSIPRTLADEPWNRLPAPLLDRLGFWLDPEERRNFETLARRVGCDLIITPDYCAPAYDLRIQYARLVTLRRFLRRVQRARVVVRDCDKRDPSEGSVTILGNGWVAFSASVAAAFYQKRTTISTWHAWTVEMHCAEFDKEFRELLRRQRERTGVLDSRAYALSRIDEAIGRIRRRMASATVPHGARGGGLAAARKIRRHMASATVRAGIRPKFGKGTKATL